MAQEEQIDDVLGARHKLFAKLVAQGIDPATAYCETGLVGDGRCGVEAIIKSEELLQDPYIQDLVQAATITEGEVTADWVKKEVRALHHLAKLKGNLSVSARSLEMLGTEIGMFRRRVALGDDPDAGAIRFRIEDMDKLIESARSK